MLLKKLHVESPCDPAIPSSGIYSEEMEEEAWTDSHTPVLITALFTVAKSRKQATKIQMSVSLQNLCAEILMLTVMVLETGPVRGE